MTHRFSLSALVPHRLWTLLALTVLCVQVAPGQSKVNWSGSKPGLFEVRGGYEFWTEKATPARTVLFPLPLSRVGQVPVTFEIVADPPEGVVQIHVRPDVLDNYVVEILLTATKEPMKVRVDWTALVLGATGDFADLPSSAIIPKSWPEEAQPWLKSTRYAQADHPAIVAVANSIRSDLKRDARDVIALVESTMERAKEIRKVQDGRCTDLGAVQALTKEGSCTSAANLLAALLRANDLPARIVAGYATWYGTHQTHYIVEVWVPKFGWYPLESTMGRLGWDPYRQIQVAVIPPEYEEENADGRFSAGSGVPYLSLTEYPGKASGWNSRGMLDEESNCDHVATLLAAYEVSSKKWAQGLKKLRPLWAHWLESAATPVTSGKMTTRLERKDFGPKDMKSLKAVLGRAKKR